MAPPNKYSPEFRDEAVQLAVNSGKSVTAVARELGINSETLRSWVRKHERDRDQSEAPTSASERARLKELERRNRELEMEVSFLKKAAAYFAKEPR